MRRLTRLVATLGLLAAGLFPAAAEGVKLRALGSGYADDKGTALQSPDGIAFVAPSSVAVADTANGRIVLFEVVARGFAPRQEIRLPELPYPQRLASNAAGELFVIDGSVRRIGRVGADGTFKGWVTPAVAGTVIPRSLRVDRAGDLYVLDAASGRLLVIEPSGTAKREVRLPAEAGTFFSDLALDGKGSVLLLDSVGRQVWILTRGAGQAERLGGSLAEELGFAVSLAVDGAGRIYVVDQGGGGVVVLGSDGSFRGRQISSGWRDGALRFPSAVASDGERQLFVADRGNNRIQVFAITQ